MLQIVFIPIVYEREMTYNQAETAVIKVVKIIDMLKDASINCLFESLF